MMVLSSLRPDASIVEYLEHRARAESLRGLVARSLLALAFVIGGLGPIPVGKPIVVSLAFTYFCYAVWGLLDRARSRSQNGRSSFSVSVLSFLCTFFVWLGVLSGIGFLMSLGFMLLGAPWIL
ncbi:MAG: hypothetical protein ACJ8AK_02640 [Gemmatimonadaceae bacterium]